MSRGPVSSRRLAAVMVPTVAAVLAVALTVGLSDPFGALLFTAGILCVSSVALPSPAWSWWFRLAGKALRAALRRRPAAPEPEDDPAEHALWLDRLRRVALMQRYSRHSHPGDCFCTCGIPLSDMQRFRAEMELIALEMRQQERGQQ